jgi:hypothetical protein
MHIAPLRDHEGGVIGLYQGPHSGVACECTEAVKAVHNPGAAKEGGRGLRQGSGDRLTVPREEAPSLEQTAPRAAVGKRKANEVDSSDSGGTLEPATRRTGSGPKPGFGPRLCLHRPSGSPH